MMKNRLLLFLILCFATWALCLGGSWLIWPDRIQVHLICSLISLGLCVVPSLVPLFWTGMAVPSQAAQMQLLAVLGSTGIRMFTVLGVGLLLSTNVVFFHDNLVTFWVWILLFYLATLAIEVTVLVRVNAA